MTHSLCIFAESGGGRAIEDPLSRLTHHLSDKRDTEGYSVSSLWDYLQTHNRYCHEASNWVFWKMWPTYLFYDSDDGDQCAADFFQKPDALYEATRTSLQEQRRNDSVPMWQKAETVAEDLFDHVRSMIITVTVKAFTINDSAEDSDQQNAASDKDSVKAFFDL